MDRYGSSLKPKHIQILYEFTFEFGVSAVRKLKLFAAGQKHMQSNPEPTGTYGHAMVKENVGSRDL
jgi:hypothetical protein